MSQSTVNSDATNQTDVPVEEVDLLVVGGGKAGKSLAMLRAKAGDKVVMVERDKVGGTCINVACIPTKTLISAARVLREVQGSQTYGVTLPEQDGGADALAQARIELASFRARKEAVVGGMGAAHEKRVPPSALDPENEENVVAAVDKLRETATILVIAHKLDTIRKADAIVQLRADGTVEDIGTHEELFARGGTYRSFWDHRAAAQGWQL